MSGIDLNQANIGTFRVLYCDSSTNNPGPSSYGVCLVIPAGSVSNYGVQIFFATVVNGAYYRRQTNGVWSNWVAL